MRASQIVQHVCILKRFGEKSIPDGLTGSPKLSILSLKKKEIPNEKVRLQSLSVCL